jgi:hypothetical protein
MAAPGPFSFRTPPTAAAAAATLPTAAAAATLPTAAAAAATLPTAAAAAATLPTAAAAAATHPTAAAAAATTTTTPATAPLTTPADVLQWAKQSAQKRKQDEVQNQKTSALRLSGPLLTRDESGQWVVDRGVVPTWLQEGEYTMIHNGRYHSRSIHYHNRFFSVNGTNEVYEYHGSLEELRLCSNVDRWTHLRRVDVETLMDSALPEHHLLIDGINMVNLTLEVWAQMDAWVWFLQTDQSTMLAPRKRPTIYSRDARLGMGIRAIPLSKVFVAVQVGENQYTLDPRITGSKPLVFMAPPSPGMQLMKTPQFYRVGQKIYIVGGEHPYAFDREFLGNDDSLRMQMINKDSIVPGSLIQPFESWIDVVRLSYFRGGRFTLNDEERALLNAHMSPWVTGTEELIEIKQDDDGWNTMETETPVLIEVVPPQDQCATIEVDGVSVVTKNPGIIMVHHTLRWRWTANTITPQHIRSIRWLTTFKTKKTVIGPSASVHRILLHALVDARMIFSMSLDENTQLVTGQGRPPIVIDGVPAVVGADTHYIAHAHQNWFKYGENVENHSCLSPALLEADVNFTMRVTYNCTGKDLCGWIPIFGHYTGSDNDFMEPIQCLSPLEYLHSTHNATVVCVKARTDSQPTTKQHVDERTGREPCEQA